MRLKVSFTCKVIPLSYRFMFVSFIKEALKTSNAVYAENLYIFENKPNKKSKNFTFSVYLKDYVLENDEFLLQNGLDWIISSPDPEFISYLVDGLNEIKEFRYKGYKLQKKNISILPEVKVKSDTVVFRTLSPIFIKDRDGKPLAPTEEGYEENFNYICDMTLRNYHGNGLKKPLQFIPMNLTKQVVKEKFDNTPNHQHFEAYKGTFLLKGDQEDLEILRQIGTSFKKSQGYGCVSVEYQ
ncbi:CRISPR-associated protein, Cas6 family [Bacillus sp. 166amftsu]|nr:CRISPR-associated protein, Cas6 family [Bacillus sp. 166amftsu]